MKSTSVYTILLGLVLLGGSCKKGEDNVTPGDCGALAQRLDALTSAAVAFSNNATKTNCEAYRKAANDYINSATGCPGVSAADIADARASIKDIVCQ